MQFHTQSIHVSRYFWPLNRKRKFKFRKNCLLTWSQISEKKWPYFSMILLLKKLLIFLFSLAFLPFSIFFLKVIYGPRIPFSTNMRPHYQYIAKLQIKPIKTMDSKNLESLYKCLVGQLFGCSFFRTLRCSRLPLTSQVPISCNFDQIFYIKFKFFSSCF